jgi:hypothetical protein
MDEAWPADGIVPLADPTMRAKYPGGFVRYQGDAIKVTEIERISTVCVPVQGRQFFISWSPRL